MKVETVRATLIITVFYIFSTDDSQRLRNLNFNHTTPVLYIIIWVFSSCFDQLTDEMTSFMTGHLKKSMHLLNPNLNMPNGYATKMNDKPLTNSNSQTMAQKEIDCIKQFERQLPPEYPCITIYFSDMECDLERKCILYIVRRWDRDDPFVSMSPFLNELERDYGRGWKFERVTNPIKVGRISTSSKPKSTFCFRYEPDCYIYKFYSD